MAKSRTRLLSRNKGSMYSRSPKYLAPSPEAQWHQHYKFSPHILDTCVDKVGWPKYNLNVRHPARADNQNQEPENARTSLPSHKCRGFCPHIRRGKTPSENPSTGCGATQRRKSTNAWITGREAHQNAGTNANATLIYSCKQADPEAHTHIPSEDAWRAKTRPRKRWS